jgi:hypothetical protein
MAASSVVLNERRMSPIDVVDGARSRQRSAIG